MAGEVAEGSGSRGDQRAESPPSRHRGLHPKDAPEPLLQPHPGDPLRTESLTGLRPSIPLQASPASSHT